MVGRTELWGRLEMNINTNFTGTLFFFFFFSYSYTFLPSGIICILAGQKMYMILRACVRISKYTGSKIFFPLEIVGENYLDGRF